MSDSGRGQGRASPKKKYCKYICIYIYMFFLLLLLLLLLWCLQLEYIKVTEFNVICLVVLVWNLTHSISATV